MGTASLCWLSSSPRLHANYSQSGSSSGAPSSNSLGGEGEGRCQTPAPSGLPCRRARLGMWPQGWGAAKITPTSPLGQGCWERCPGDRE